MMNLESKKIAILGFGVEGVGLAEFLSGRNIPFTILDVKDQESVLGGLTADQQEQARKYLGDEKVEKRLGDSYLSEVDDFDIIFRSPGISANDPLLIKAKQTGTIISSQIKLFFDLCPAVIIGVTGTKGKGTTSSLIYEILKQAGKDVYIAGNIGYPAITLLPGLSKESIVILELSSFQLMDLEKSPHIAIITNLGQDHLDYHKDLIEYNNAKFNILKNQTEDDYAILNKDSTFSEKMLEEVKSKKIFFSRNDSADAVVQNEEVVLKTQSNQIICKLADIRLKGKHNLENIAAASLAVDVLGINIGTIGSVVREFTGLPHRLEFVANVDGVEFINDSYATNPGPTIAAINSFKENKVLILGGSSKGADFDGLAEVIQASNVKSVILIGVEGSRIKESLSRKKYAGRVIDGKNNIEDIVKLAREEAKSGEVVIFSPACASFDMFKNYKDRGEKFKAAVLALK